MNSGQRVLITETFFSRVYLQSSAEGLHIAKYPKQKSRESKILNILNDTSSSVLPVLINADTKSIVIQKLELPVLNQHCLQDLLIRYAQLQIESRNQLDRLKQIGVTDTRLLEFDGDLIQWMASQNPSLVEKLKKCLFHIRSSSVPMTLEHGDLHVGNIMSDGQVLKIIDWSEVSIAHPFLSVAHLMNDPRFDFNRELLWHTYLCQWRSFAQMDVLEQTSILVTEFAWAYFAHRYYQIGKSMPKEESLVFLNFSSFALERFEHA